MTHIDTILGRLATLLDDDPELSAWLCRSLESAHDRAAADMDEQLFDVLSWPRDVDSYRDYVAGFARWIPQQTNHPAWREQDPHHRNAKEVSDRIAHFFWLVDQHRDPAAEAEADVDSRGTDGAIGENSAGFRDWMTDFAREWGSFLDTAESFDDEILQSFLDYAPEYTVEESLVDGRSNMPSGWLTFNQFFARELNAGLRPIADPHTNQVIACPADCSYEHTYDIDAASEIPATRIKGTHAYGNIAQLLEGSAYADTFAGGTFVHYMLPPSSYHRFHVPVGGTVAESYVVQGRVFMQVDLTDGQLRSRDSTASGYEFSQTRGVLTIDTRGSQGGDIGVVGVVPVGMSHVGSVVLTSAAGRQVAKGDEFGYFQFGGSDIILLFQPGVAVDVDTDGRPRHVGSLAARVTP